MADLDLMPWTAGWSPLDRELMSLTGYSRIAENASNQQVFVFHGDEDDAVNVSASRQMMEAFEKAGLAGKNVHYFEMPGVTHFAWDFAYRDASLFRRVEDVRRNPFPERVVYSTFSPRYCKAYWLRIDRIDRGLVLARIEGTQKDHQHTTHLEAAAKAGKHVYVEKPMAKSMDALNKAYDAVKAAGICVQVGTNMRSVPFNVGRREFFQKPTGDQAKDAHLIGQFGVGFYSSFIVADRVTLTTRRAGLPAGEGVRWEPAGEGDYTIEYCQRPQRGIEIVLHLREGHDDLLSRWRLAAIVRKYSDHIALPILMKKEVWGEEKKAFRTADEDETILQTVAPSH